MKIKQLKSWQYANSVLKGKEIASKFIKLAAERFMHDLERSDLSFNIKTVETVNNFLEKVVYVPETKKPNVIYPPHAFWIDQIYGFRYKESDLRKYRTIYNQFARKQFKTFYAANITLIEALLWRDQYPEILQGANSRDQALICTTKTAEIIRKSPTLNRMWTNNNGVIKMYNHKEHTNTILYDAAGRKSVIKAIPRDLGDGGNPSIGVVDEYHEAKTSALLETYRSGQGQRLEPMTIIITSPGSNKSGPCYEERLSSDKMLKGEIEDDRHLAIIFELDNEDEWDNIDMLQKSNPMMPYSPTLKPYLIDRISEAKKKGGSQMANIKIKNCGIWIDAPEIWIESEIIDTNYSELPDDLKSYPTYVGFDLAKGEDLNALSLITDVNGYYHVTMYYWIPESKINDESDGVDYRKWVEEGWVRYQPGNVIDMIELGEEIRDILMEWEDIQSIAYDARYANMGAVPILARGGYEDKLVPVGQGFTLSPATIQLEQWIKQGKMNLQRNPVLKWNYANTVLRVGDKDDVYPHKVNKSNKIDGVIAKAIAITEYLRINSEYNTNIYIGGI